MKYVTLGGDWPLSSQVGNSGAANIYEFYRLIKELRTDEVRYTCIGRLYDDKDFNALFYGQCYPGFVESPRNWASYWWDDFADTGTSHLTREQLEEYQGREFVLAQDIVLAYLGRAG